MVSQKLCVPHGAPGVKFYHFEGVQAGKEPARVQQYLMAFDQLQLGEDVRNQMLKVMKRIYMDTEAMMTEIFDMNPASGVSYRSSKEEGERELPAPCKEQLTLSLQELRQFTGEDKGRILVSLAGELLDVSSGREMYGPGSGYSILAGHDVTRCLATMSLEPEHLDDLRWSPDCAEDEDALNQWRQRLKEKYPVAGQLTSAADTADATGAEGLRKRPAGKEEAKAPNAVTAGGHAEGDRCPISGKQGTCPMAAIMGIQKPAEKAEPAALGTSSGGAFMAGKSLVASVQKKNSFDDSLLYRLCPLHWDDKTIKMVCMIAAASWMSGIFIGWNLRKMLVR
ncbi:vem-1 [Symbiodinium natans]|uniref:Vem-1 protein n=1 Tax=Symbiodinium natans TaxID=878477 RepID=A0A812T4C3_9DINO|nr:vem-1 [Symbiodinium natans]